MCNNNYWICVPDHQMIKKSTFENAKGSGTTEQSGGESAREGLIKASLWRLDCKNRDRKMKSESAGMSWSRPLPY